jgi:hypothetical protein
VFWPPPPPAATPYRAILLLQRPLPHCWAKRRLLPPPLQGEAHRSAAVSRPSGTATACCDTMMEGITCWHEAGWGAEARDWAGGGQGLGERAAGGVVSAGPQFVCVLSTMGVGMGGGGGGGNEGRGRGSKGGRGACPVPEGRGRGRRGRPCHGVGQALAQPVLACEAHTTPLA